MFKNYLLILLTWKENWIHDIVNQIYKVFAKIIGFIVIYERCQAERWSSKQIYTSSTSEWNLIIKCIYETPRKDCVLVICYSGDRYGLLASCYVLDISNQNNCYWCVFSSFCLFVSSCLLFTFGIYWQAFDIRNQVVQRLTKG